MLIYFSSEPFYVDNIHLPHDHDHVLPEFLENTKFYPFFKDALGAIDGMYISCNSTAEDQQVVCDHNGSLTQNCLAICSFNTSFCIYLVVGEGSIWLHYIWGCTYHWSSHLAWEVLSSRFRISHLWITHCFLLGWILPPHRVGLCPTSVCLWSIKLHFSANEYLVSWNGALRFCYTHLK